MPHIRPTSDLRNKFNEISELCHTTGKPVYITRNGRGDLVVMSQEAYERQEDLLELYRKLAEAESEAASGAPTINHRQMMEQLREPLPATLKSAKKRPNR